MKYINKICGKISLLFYIVVLYQLRNLCQYGNLQGHLPMLMASTIGFLLTFVLWLISRKQKQEDASKNNKYKKIVWIERIVLLVATIYFGAGIIHSAIPYHGALSWKLEEWMQKKEVRLEHNNFFADGVEGVLTDLNQALDLPEELYLANQYQMTFDPDGTIQTIYTLLYGSDESGATKTYLVDYDADKSKNMTVWLDGEADVKYDENMRLEPMLRILARADCEQTVKAWSQDHNADRYEILYLGRRSFQTEEGLKYLPGDVDGDGVETGINDFLQLSAGGEIIGFEVSLHIPAEKEVTPVRYIMEPEYIGQEELKKAREEQQAADAKDAESWTVDTTDGTMYFFLDDDRGWRLVVADAAAGSRFYIMEKTENGGLTWERANEDPFEGNAGTAEGLVFFDENFGFAGLAGASQSHSKLYVTRDGGVTFASLQFPMERVIELPELAAECGFTVEDYDYFSMPEKENGILTVKVVTDAVESEGLFFQSKDDGETWEYVGTALR